MKKTGRGINEIKKPIKNSKHKISSKKNKEKISYINLISESNNSTRSNNTKKPLFISTTLLNFEYEYILQKLLKYLKQKLTIIQYEDIISFIRNEINKIILNKNISNNYSLLDQNDSIKYIKKVCKTKRNNTSNTNSINNFYLNINSYNNYPNKEVNNEQKLKLSYDFSNRLISPSNNINNKPIKIVLENIIITEKAKSTSKSNYLKNYKDKYSLYSIIKNSNSYSYRNKYKDIINYSKCKSKSKSTSRENIINNINNNKINNTKNDNITISNTNVIQINTSSLMTKGVFNSNSYNTISNNNMKNIFQKNKKVSIKSTLIHQSHPLLNEKLFSKLTNTYNRRKTSQNSNVVYNTISNISMSKITKNISYKTEPNISHNINISFSNKSSTKKNKCNSSRINSYRQKENSKNIKTSSKKRNKAILTINIPNQYNNLSRIDNNQNKILNIAPKYINKQSILKDKNRQIPILKNDEMLKQIKNTIDDNLKIMFNFSYENFLSKQSEHESKEISREIEMNISDENI